MHRDDEGALAANLSTTLAGPTIVVEEVIASLGVGATTGVRGVTRTWLLQSATDYWEHTFPAEAPLRAPLVRGTRIDISDGRVRPADHRAGRDR